jgi:hypothetical protein
LWLLLLWLLCAVVVVVVAMLVVVLVVLVLGFFLTRMTTKTPFRSETQRRSEINSRLVRRRRRRNEHSLLKEKTEVLNRSRARPNIAPEWGAPTALSASASWELLAQPKLLAEPKLLTEPKLPEPKLLTESKLRPQRPLLLRLGPEPKPRRAT